MARQTKTETKLTASIAAVAVLAVCLCVTTAALVYAMVTADHNLFQTGTVEVNLNDGKPVIGADCLFEPGMTVEKAFFIENESTWDLYYKLYLDHVEGGLADVLEVSIRDGETILFSGKAADLTRDKVGAADDILNRHDRRELTISFHMPASAGNRAQDRFLHFDLRADAVQTKNNPHKLFD